MTQKIELVEANDESPICPHCEKELDKVLYKSKGFPLFSGRHTMYFCPHCKKVIGFSQGRMA
ncbi:hypothetical protein CA13_11180 [Planctomycetes bacterium CA13]|uniref:Uncharacterized protein n=1 Tax=Novipirellula herctigrandis TaxID=2527986 RepID=A0A5C5YYP2_9BACT|nr:hypothetical protein CA13_11180 [Planctomycetes bacterium CA13]